MTDEEKRQKLRDAGLTRLAKKLVPWYLETTRGTVQVMRALRTAYDAGARSRNEDVDRLAWDLNTAKAELTKRMDAEQQLEQIRFHLAAIVEIGRKS